MSELIRILSPETLQDTPRIFTAIAEWGAVMIHCFIYKRKVKNPVFIFIAAFSLVIQIVFQVFAGMAPTYVWIVNMALAVVIMYIIHYLILDMSKWSKIVLTVQAFLIAEFTASLYRQLYVWYVNLGYSGVIPSTILMILVYGITFYTFYNTDKKNGEYSSYDVTKGKDVAAAVVTGIGVFSLSNMSFYWTNTPFSVTSYSLLYVRTLVDLAGVMMLLTQRSRLVENEISRENAAINQLFRRQYEQYKLSIDNSEMLRKEIHDMKHYIVAIKNETDVEKKKVYLEELEQEIAVQESFQNTGNSVLDVILTNKSLVCKKGGITLNAMVDGNIVDYMHVKDICALFGNILDNAIEAVSQVEDADKKLITLSVKSKNSFVIIECENYSTQKLNLDKRDKLPQTTKADKTLHGYGLKSISQVAEKYNGSMNVTQKEGWVTVKILLSRPEITECP